jgi:hypothetical protein
MKKYIIVLSFLFISCNDKEVAQTPIQEEVVLEYQDPKKVDSLLEMVDGFKISVDEVIYEKQTLKVDNKKLNKELVLVNDNNQINEKSFVGVISFFMMVLAFLVDIVTGIFGKKLIIEEFIFNGFLMLTSVVFGIATAGKIFNKKEDKDATE